MPSVSTVGYGGLAPETFADKMFTIAYVTLGFVTVRARVIIIIIITTTIIIITTTTTTTTTRPPRPPAG